MVGPCSYPSEAVVNIVTGEISDMIHRQCHAEMHGGHMGGCYMPPDKETKQEGRVGTGNTKLSVD